LETIRFLVVPAPSAFTPFLQDFFIKATDPAFARFAKLEILTALAISQPSVDLVLRELRTYIRHDDKAFVVASVQAVGRLASMCVPRGLASEIERKPRGATAAAATAAAAALLHMRLESHRCCPRPTPNSSLAGTRRLSSTGRTWPRTASGACSRSS
jgi:hypothetical protein